MTKPISPLRQRMIDDMKIRNMSPNSQKVYAHSHSPPRSWLKKEIPVAQC